MPLNILTATETNEMNDYNAHEDLTETTLDSAHYTRIIREIIEQKRQAALIESMIGSLSDADLDPID